MTHPPNQEQSTTKTWPGRDWIAALFLFAAVLLAYHPASVAGFIWDDDDYVVNNKLLTAPDGLWRIWFSFDSPSQYFPLVYTLFRVERFFWGLDPAGYHWVNILLHGANALLLWRLLGRLKIPGAFLAAAIFALHPVQVESVAWITELKNVLMGFFFLLSLLAWTRFIGGRNDRARYFYALSLFFYAMALFSKTTACTLPAALVLILWLQGERIDRRRLFQVAPFMVLGIGMGLLTVWWERYHQGTRGTMFALGLPDRLLIATHAVWFYAGKLLWPARLAFSYPHWKLPSADPLAWGWLPALCGLGGAALFARRFAGWSACAALAFFVATLSPVLGFFMLYTFRYSYVADHYQYLACIGPIALVSAGIARLDGLCGRYQPLAIPALSAILLGVLASLTWRQCATYRDMETLWRATLARNPESWLAHNNLGTVLMEQGLTEDGVAQFRESLRINPAYEDARYNLGRYLQDQGRTEEAISQFRQALSTRPDYPDARNSLGNALLQQWRTSEALAEFHEALRLDPAFALARSNLGYALFLLGQTENAIAQYREALRIKPALTLALNNLRAALLQRRQTGNAIAQYREALRLNPSDVVAGNNLGCLLFQQGEAREAISRIQKALDLLPANRDLQNTLAWMLATAPQTSLRNGPRAVELVARASQSSGGANPDILHILAAAYACNGEFPKAVQTAQTALQLAEAQSNPRLADSLRREINLYRAGRQFEDVR
jgi:tetratricopeptide (TPR) repeat protein